jgi:hypothetical protein
MKSIPVYSKHSFENGIIQTIHHIRGISSITANISNEKKAEAKRKKQTVKEEVRNGEIE